MTLERKLALWGPVVGWCALIFYLSNQPHLRITEAWWDIIARKIAHVGEYAVLAWLTGRAFKGSTVWTRRRILGWTLVFCVLYAVSDEWHQHFIPGRVASPVDVMIDSLGVLLALAKMKASWIRSL